MTRSIDRDVGRFKQILRGKVRENLRKYITHGEMIGRTGRELVSIPVPAIDIPHFRHGQKGSGGVGQGEGEVGQPVGKGQGQEGTAKARPATSPALTSARSKSRSRSWPTCWATRSNCPTSSPRAKNRSRAARTSYTSIRQTGPDSLRHFKRTFKRALKRQVTLDNYNFDNPVVIPMREDERFRSWKTVTEPESNAAVIYMMDVSGSMTDDQKEIVRIESFWIDTWLKRQYDGVQRRYIVHDAAAHEVDEDTFYRTRESGGTRIIVGLPGRLADHHPRLSAVRMEHLLLPVLRRRQLGRRQRRLPEVPHGRPAPLLNLFCYGQVESPYGSGDYIRELRKICEKFDNLILSEIDGKEAIYDSIKEFLGTGK